MTGEPSHAAVPRFAVIGYPVEHSQSPYIHGAFAAAAGLAIDYQRLPVQPGNFAQALQGFAAQGASGCNVTVPFKFDVPALCRLVSDRARQAGAANTVRFDADGWACNNTDGIGLVRDLRDNAGLTLAGRRLLLVGAGGAAAGVLAPLLQERPAEVLVANRNEARAVELAARNAGWAAAHGVTLRASGLAPCQDGAERGFDLVINASSSSLAGGPVPVSPAVLATDATAVDLMYGAAAQPFLQWARAHGAQPRDGLGMLVEQAAEAFWFFLGVRPATAQVLTALRARIANPLEQNQ